MQTDLKENSMENKNMFRVTVDGKERLYPAGTPYQTVADEVQGDHAHDILLVNRDGKLRELYKTIQRDCTLAMVTAADKPGRQTYERSAILLMLKAFYDTVGRDKVKNVRVEFSLSNALCSAAPDVWYGIAGTYFTPELSRDWEDDRTYWAALESPLEDRAGQTYDAFLRQNDQQLGLRSYGACVDLLVAWEKSSA